MHSKCGKLVRTGPNEVSVNDLSALKKIYAAGTRFSKSSWYEVFQGHRKFDLFAGSSEIHCAWLRQVPTLYWIHDFLSPVIGNHLGVTARHGRIRDFASQEIESREGLGRDLQDILAKLLEVQQQRPDEMNDANALSMATTNISAGSDTTAISTRSVIYYLLKNPECKEEINTQMKEAKLTEIITLEQTKRIPYLQACLYEGLRLQPAIEMSLPRVTSPGGVEIDGHFIPEGVRLQPLA